MTLNAQKTDTVKCICKKYMIKKVLFEFDPTYFLILKVSCDRTKILKM